MCWENDRGAAREEIWWHTDEPLPFLIIDLTSLCEDSAIDMIDFFPSVSNFHRLIRRHISQITTSLQFNPNCIVCEGVLLSPPPLRIQHASLETKITKIERDESVKTSFIEAIKGLDRSSHPWLSIHGVLVFPRPRFGHRFPLGL